jgi:hypothetical protein
MEKRVSRLEEKLEELTGQLERLNERLSLLESRVLGGGVLPESPLPVSQPEPGSREQVAEPETLSPPRSPWLHVIGRTLVVLGGGFLLRAITEGEILSRGAGTAVGLAYALVWLVLADRAGRKGKSRSATFHGLAGILIAFPLLWEATSKYAFLSPVTSILISTAFALVALAIAWRRRLRGLAWANSFAVAAFAFAVTVWSGDLVPGALFFVLFGLVTLWLGYVRDWFGLAWITAFFVDTIILVIVVLLLAVPDPSTRFGLEPHLVILVQVFAVLAYLGSIAIRTLLRHRDVIIFEVLQTAALLILWLGVSIHMARSTGIALVPLGLGCIALSAVCYGIAFNVIDRRAGGRRNFIYYTTLAIVLALFGGGVLLGSASLSLVFVAMSLLTAWFARRYSRVTLAGHSVFYILAAAIWSGLVAAATGSLVGSGGNLDQWSSFPVLIVLAAALVVGLAPITTHRRTWGPLAHAPKVLLLVLLVYCLDGLVAALLIGAIGDGGAAGTDMAAVAAIRTTVLAVLAFSLAWIARYDRFLEAAWLVYPLLVVGGLKLVLEDLRAGRPATLFVSLAVYGGVLIFAPRLLRRSKESH